MAIDYFPIAAHPKIFCSSTQPQFANTNTISYLFAILVLYSSYSSPVIFTFFPATLLVPSHKVIIQREKMLLVILQKKPQEALCSEDFSLSEEFITAALPLTVRRHGCAYKNKCLLTGNFSISTIINIFLCPVRSIHSNRTVV